MSQIARKYLRSLDAALTGAFGPMAWVWFSILAAVALLGGQLWISSLRSDLENAYGAELATLRQARLDLMKGYQHLAFSGTPDSPYDRLQGMALLRQAMEEFDSAPRQHRHTILLPDDAPRSDEREAFAASVDRMRTLLSQLPPGGEIDAARKVEIRTLLYGLESQAAIADARIRQERIATVKRIQIFHTFGLWAAAALLAAICGAAWAGGRARLRAERELRRNEANLAITLQSIGDAVIATDIESRIVRMNPTAEKLTGWPQAEGIGRRLTEVFRIVNALTREAVQNPVSLVLERGEVIGLANHTTLLARHGSEYQIADSAAPIRDTAGRIVGVVLVFHDVTAQYSMQQSLQASEAMHRLLAENISDVIWVLDLETLHFRYVSPSVERLLGFKPEETTARPASESMTPDSYAFVQKVVPERLKRAQEGLREHYTDEVHQPHKDGRIIPTEVVSHFRRNDDTGHWEVYGVTRDISARKKAEEMQAALATQLRQAQKLDAVGQLAGGVAHDFNNMLAALMLQLNMLEMRADLDPEIRAIAQELTIETKRAASLTRQLLMFSRKSVLQTQQLDLNESIDEMIKMLRRLIGENIELIFQSESSLSPVEADPGMMQQVIMNLAVNARDAMPEGGAITITTRNVAFTAEEAESVHDRRPGRFVCLSVADNGCGMDAPVLKRIFEPFFTTKELGRGTGLGLSTVHGIVAQHHGWLEVVSEPGKGSEFRVYLPAMEVEAKKSASKEAFEQPLPGTETILFVEDELIVRRITERSLQQLGYKVLTARNADEAFLLWNRHKADVDLLLTDMMLPEGIHGLELSKRLRVERPELRVIIASGYSSELITRAGSPQEGFLYLSKPYTLATLTAALRSCLG